MAGLFGGSPPSPPKPPPPPPPVEPDNSEELAALARKRKSLNAQRTGVRKLTIPADTGGLRIIE